jgi:hypothetical protein
MKRAASQAADNAVRKLPQGSDALEATEWQALDLALAEFAASGTAEVREDGEWLADLAAFQYELKTEGRDPVVHLWSDARNLTRRIVSIREQSSQRVVLDVRKFGRAKPVKLEFLRRDSARPENRVSREQFRARFERILAERFPDAIVDSLTASPDLEHSFSGIYVRGVMHEGPRAWALLAASSEETAASIEGMLAFGLIWLDWARSHSAKRAIEGLRLFVPAGGAASISEKLPGISTGSARVEIFEMVGHDAEMRRVPTSDAGNLKSWLVPRRDVEAALTRAQDAFGRIRAMWPNPAAQIELRPSPDAKEVAFCFKGLAFARWTREGVLFGLGNAQKPLTEKSERALEKILHQLDLHRNAEARDVNHWMFRASPERWLESMAIQEPTRIDAQLDQRFFYSQVPALTANGRGIVDLLGITRQGRLVVIELKAKEDIQLPLQAIDYWLRVRRHQLQNDFHAEGYFTGVEIDSRPPLVWLVASGFQFHPSTATLLKYLSPEIQITKIGLNEKWRSGIKVLFRQ